MVDMICEGGGDVDDDGLILYQLYSTGLDFDIDIDIGIQPVNT